MANDKNTAEQITDKLKGAGEAMRQSGQQAAENTVALSKKMIDHAEENTREAFAAMRAAAGSKSIQDVMQVQADFLKAQGTRSMAQAREIGETIMAFGKNAVDFVRGAGDKD